MYKKRLGMYDVNPGALLCFRRGGAFDGSRSGGRDPHE